LLLSASIGILAFAVDIGWIGYARNQLQVAADAAALAGASELIGGPSSAEEQARLYVSENPVGGLHEHATIADDGVQFGTWDPDLEEFIPSEGVGNAIEITVRKRLPLIIGPLLGIPHIDMECTAVALANPRDIAFVLDLSGSMNNDTEIWATQAINNEFPDYPGIGDDLMADVYEDFGYGSYPGTLRHVAQGLSGAPDNDSSYSWLANTYLMNNSSVATQYCTLSSDSTSTRKTKAYRWIIDYQLATIMPAALPTPDSSTNLSYWTAYLDYIIKPYNSLPPNQNSHRISITGNPYRDAWPALGSSSYSGFYNKLGYRTYVQFMMDYGRNKEPNSTVNVPLSAASDDCPWNVDNDPDSPGYGRSFPPREQPTHAMKLAVMAAVDRIAEINANYPEVSKDHICVIAFDTAAGSRVVYPLSVDECDYEAIKDAVCGLQAVADGTSSTASENGLIKARNHMDPTVNQNGPRWAARRLIVFVTDGIPNIKQSSNTTINNYRSANPDGEWFTSGSNPYERNAVLMQTAQMEAKAWKVFAVGMGLGADRSMLDRMARMAGTAEENPDDPDGPLISPWATGNPANYEQRLASIFNAILGAPFVRLAR